MDKITKIMRCHITAAVLGTTKFSVIYSLSLVFLIVGQQIKNQRLQRVVQAVVQIKKDRGRRRK
jgi:hypothetical protein